MKGKIIHIISAACVVKGSFLAIHNCNWIEPAVVQTIHCIAICSLWCRHLE